MILPINHQFRIAADENCWSIQERYVNGKTQAESWRAIKWYNSLSQVVTALADLMLRTSEASTLDEALREVKQIELTLTAALTPMKEAA